MVRRRALYAVAAVALGGAGAAGAATPPVTAKASLTPSTHLFGDGIEARLDVAVDNRVVDPDTVAIDADFRPYTTLDERTERQRVGASTLVTLTARLRCLAQPCLPRAVRRRIDLRPARVTWQAAGGQEQVLRHRWPALSVVSRLGPLELQDLGTPSRPPWRADLSTMPAVSYRVGSQALFWTLVALAAVLAAAGIFLLGRYRPRRAPARVEQAPALDLPPLERALALLEIARARGSFPDQRRALELLAAELSETGEGTLSSAARTLAWSSTAPPPDATGTLAANVRDLIEKSSNGHARQ